MLNNNIVKYIANLSRINLDKDEVESFTRNLEDILSYIEKLNALNTDDITPTSHVLELENVYREDVIKPSLSQKAALDMSVSNHKGAFKVPKVIE